MNSIELVFKTIIGGLTFGRSWSYPASSGRHFIEWLPASVSHDITRYDLLIEPGTDATVIAQWVEALIDSKNGDYCLVEKNADGSYNLEWISEGSGPDYDNLVTRYGLDEINHWIADGVDCGQPRS